LSIMSSIDVYFLCGFNGLLSHVGAHIGIDTRFETRCHSLGEARSKARRD